jgi:UDP-glucose 4-epimerase
MSIGPPVVLVGGAGFIGRHLAARLLAEGQAVIILDRRPPAVPSGARVELGDLSDPVTVGRVLRPGAVLVHLAWSTLPATSNEDPAADLRENVLGSLSMLQVCRERGVSRILYVSSGGTVYGQPQHLPIRETHPTEPICAYGISKLAVEKYLALFHQLHGLDFLIVRPSNAYGPSQDPSRGQSAVTVFTHRAIRNEPITIWGDGGIVRDFLWVGDLVDAILRLIRYEPGPSGLRIFNVSTGQGTSLRDLVGMISRALVRQVEVAYAPGRSLDVTANVLDSSRLREVTGWFPQVALSEGITRMLRAWEAEGVLPVGSRGRA